MSSRPADAKQIFLDALEQPAEQRQAFIEAACRGDSSLRRRVDDLLRCNAADGGILDQSPPIQLSALEDMSASQSPGRIGEYDLVRIVGRGGFGVVWLAEQQAPLRRRVALKLLHPSLIGFGAMPGAASEVIARFEAERQALAAMDHPNVARVFDAGTVTDGPHAGQPYFVMEYIDGQPITNYCDEHKLDLIARLELFIKVCSAVQHAHQKGLIHRDLKPGNILVSTIDHEPTPKVIDFGVAKAVGDAAEPGSGLTHQSQIIGTPQYMPPEQAQASMSQVDTRSDVYSLGAMLYELLTGAPPIDVGTLRGSSVQQICKAVCEVTPAKPSQRTPSVTDRPSFASLLRGELDWIVMKALEKDPPRRYQSAADLAGDIERHLAHQPVLAGPPSRIYRARKFVRRHRAGVLTTVILLLALVGATAFSLLQASRARRAEREAVAQREQARTELAKYTSLAKFSQQILTSIDPAVARGRDTTLMESVLSAASTRADAELADQPEVAQSIHTTLGFAYAAIGNAAVAQSHYERALAIAERLHGERHPIALDLRVNTFAMLVEQGKYAEAEAYAAALPAAFDSAGVGESAEAMSLFTNLGGLYLRQKRFADALPLLQRAADGRIKLHGEGDAKTFAALNNLAYAYMELKQYEQSNATWLKLLNYQQTRLGEDHPQTLGTINNLAMLAERKGDLATAEAMLKQALAGKRRIHQPGHPSRVISELNMGTFYWEHGRFAEAAEILEPAFRDASASMPTTDERRMVMALRLADVRRRVNRPADARPLAAECRAFFSKDATDSRGMQALALQLAIAVDLQDRATCQSLLSTAEPGFAPAAKMPPGVRAALNLHAARAQKLLGDDTAAARQLLAAQEAAGQLRPTDTVRQDVEQFRKKQ